MCMDQPLREELAGNWPFSQICSLKLQVSPAEIPKPSPTLISAAGVCNEPLWD